MRGPRVADPRRPCRIRRVDPVTGMLETVAGSGVLHDCDGEDVPATSICLLPTAMAIDGDQLVFTSAGRLLVVDVVTGLLRKVPGSPTVVDYGEVTTAPPRCLFGRAMAFDGVGRLLVTDVATSSVRRVTMPARADH